MQIVKEQEYPLPGVKIIAKLVNNERKFLRSPTANVTVTAHIVGDISENALQKALKQLPSIHLLTGVRVEFDSHHNAFFTQNNVPAIPLRIVARKSDTTWFESIQQEHGIPFNPEQGPLLRVILNYSPEKSELTVFAQHAICDATALAYFLRDLLILITDPNAHIEPVSVPRLEISSIPSMHKSDGFATKIKKKIIKIMNKKWLAHPYYFDQADFEAVHEAYIAKYKYNAVIMELNPDQNPLLLQKCREHGVTMNSALTTAFLMAFQSQGGAFRRKQPNLAIPYDLRSRLEGVPSNSFGLFVSSIEIQAQIDPQRSFWDNVEKFHAIAKKKIQSREIFGPVQNMDLLDPTLIDVMTSFAVHGDLVPPESLRYAKIHSFVSDTKNIAIQIAHKFLSALPDMINTNLGRLDFPTVYGDLRLEKMYFAPSASQIIPLLLGIVGVGGRTTVTLNYLETRDAEEEHQRARLERVKQAAMKYLLSN